MLNYIKGYIPFTFKKQIKKILSFEKIELPYIELHLTDHCNVNCKGCAHYCPVTLPHFTDIKIYDNDMLRLAQLFDNIRVIRLMGGEPLLHPNPAHFITSARSIFPRSRIQFVTNGILLTKAPASFWGACRNTDTNIYISLYPPFQKHASAWRKVCDREGVAVLMEEVNTFCAHMNPNGDSDKAKAFKICRSKFFHPFLKDGRIYTCFMVATIHHFNAQFGTTIIADPGIDIYASGMSCQKIIKYLDTPIETCRWCSYEFEPFAWSVSKKISLITQDDWNAAAQCVKEGEAPKINTKVEK